VARKKPTGKSTRKKLAPSSKLKPRKKLPRKKAIRKRKPTIAKLSARGLPVIAEALEVGAIDDAADDVLSLEMDDDFPPDIGGSE
jgi:hypothetical protein